MSKPTAPKNETTDVTRTRVPLMDYATLTADDAPPVTRGASGGDKFAKLEGTPFVAWLTDSKDAERAKSVTLPNQDTAKQVAYLLRLAAEKTGLGVRIPSVNGQYPTTDDGQVKLTFQGTDRRKYDGHRKPVQRKAESNAEFSARVGEWEKVTGRKFSE